VVVGGRSGLEVKTLVGPRKVSIVGGEELAWCLELSVVRTLR